MRNIQKEKKKISSGDPLLRFSHLPVQRLWRKLQGCLFFFFATCGLNMHPDVKKVSRMVFNFLAK